MERAERWRRLCDGIATRMMESPELPDLYKQATVEGRSLLTSFRQIPEQDKVDLICGLLAGALPSIVSARQPLAYFRTALTRRAIDWVRRAERIGEPPHLVKVEGTDEEEPSSSIENLSADCLAHSDEESPWQIDAQRTLSSFSLRDRMVLVAVAMGEDRMEIARLFGVTRTAINQVVSRARAKI